MSGQNKKGGCLLNHNDHALPAAAEVHARENRKGFFAAQVEENRHSLFRVARSILRNSADAEDAVSKAVLRAYRKLHTLKAPESFRPWIMKILVRECYAQRKRSAKILLQPNAPDSAAAETPPRMLWDAVQSLPEPYRIAAVLFYYEDLPIETIAGLLGISQGTVKSRLYRAREHLRHELNLEE